MKKPTIQELKKEINRLRKVIKNHYRCSCNHPNTEWCNYKEVLK